jgi:hypothetical protein
MADVLPHAAMIWRVFLLGVDDGVVVERSARK